MGYGRRTVGWYRRPVTEQTRFLTFAVSTAIVIGVIAFVLWYR
jgi:hypothetical protein